MSTVETLVGAVYEGRYAIERVLSIGGMGTLFKATQLAVARTVAVRVVNPQKVTDPAKVERFITEARKLASFSHANVIDLIDFGQDAQGRLFQVREYLEGERLHQLIERDAPVQPERIAHIAAQILDALAEAHANGILHRDLNPRNIFVTTIGVHSDFIKLLEFRLAHGRDDTWVERDPDKPNYSSPEILQEDTMPVDDRSDLYSLGCICYEMLTGHVPFAYATYGDVKRAQISEQPPPPHVGGQQVHGRLVDLILACMQKSPDDRPEDAAEALAILRDGGGPLLALGAASAQTPPVPEPIADPYASTARDMDQVEVEVDPGHQVMGTGPLLRHHTTTIRHTGRDAVMMEADCELPGASGSATFSYRPKRRLLPFVIAGVLLGGIALAAVVLFGEQLGLVEPKTAAAETATAQADPSSDDEAKPVAEAPPSDDDAASTKTAAKAAKPQAADAKAGAAKTATGSNDAKPAAAAKTDKDAGTSPDTAVTADASGDTGPSAAAPSKDATGPQTIVAVKVRVDTVPTGAIVINGANGKAVAKTPAILQFASNQPPLLRLEMEGYKSHELTLTASSKDMTLTLAKADPPPVAPSEPDAAAPTKDAATPEAGAKSPKRPTKRKKKKPRKKKKVRGVKDLL